MARKEANDEATPNAEELQAMDAPKQDVNALAIRQASNDVALGSVAGEVGSDDVRLARLQIAYGVGGLAEGFNPGDLVLGGDNLLVKKSEPIKIIVLSALKYWKEYTKYVQGGPKPRTYLTEQEVAANGGTTRWVNGVGPSYSPAMDLKLLIEQPANLVCGLFGIPLGDKVYAPAVWTVDKSAYKRIGPTILTAAQFNLRERGLTSGVFELKTGTEKINGNITVVPLLKLAGHNTDEVVAQIRALFVRTAVNEEAPF